MLFTVCCCVVAAAAVQAEKGCALLLSNDAGAMLFSCPAREGFAFGLRFVHSVAQSPVEEWFYVEGGMIYLDRTVYQDFGAGLPHAPEAGQTMTTTNGHIVISGYRRPLPSFTVRVGRVAGHRLLLPPAEGMGAWREIPLDSLSPAGSAVTFSLSRADG